MQEGRLIVIIEPMYSGKTSDLISFVEIYALGKNDTEREFRRLNIFSRNSCSGVFSISSKTSVEAKRSNSLPFC